MQLLYRGLEWYLNGCVRDSERLHRWLMFRQSWVRRRSGYFQRGRERRAAIEESYNKS
jgi:hypothetical protein